MENIGVIAFGTFSLFMIKIAWDLTRFADEQKKERQ